MSSRNIQ